jgi:hypothetical protein
VVDHFHLVQLANQMVSSVRRRGDRDAAGVPGPQRRAAWSLRRTPRPAGPGPYQYGPPPDLPPSMDFLPMRPLQRHPRTAPTRRDHPGPRPSRHGGRR